MKKFTVVTGNGSTYTYIADRMELSGKFVQFFEGGNVVGIKDTYGVVSISDQPYNQKYV